MSMVARTSHESPDISTMLIIAVHRFRSSRSGQKLRLSSRIHRNDKSLNEGTVCAGRHRPGPLLGAISQLLHRRTPTQGKIAFKWSKYLFISTRLRESRLLTSSDRRHNSNAISKREMCFSESRVHIIGKCEKNLVK